MKDFFYCIITLFCTVFIGNAQAVSTFAGSGVAGATNGTGTVAQFNNPSAICVDNTHNVYVADSNNNVIRKISATGVVTTLAGSGVAGFADGTGTAAQFNNPSGICTDGYYIYVADTNNNRIRIITAAGVVTTLAGSTQGYVDGTGIGAKFNAPMGICLTTGGIVYVADTSNNKIRRITATGVVTTFVGSTQGYADGTGTVAQFNGPRGVTAEGSDIYVTDTNNNRIRKITLTGVVTTYAGSTQGYSDGSGTTAKFDNPTSISMDANGQLYVTDQNNNRIRKIYTYNPNLGSVATYSGSNQGYLDGNVSTALFNAPKGIFIDSNILYLADSGNNIIRKTTICDIYPRFQYYGVNNSFCATAGNIDVMEISGTYTNITFSGSTGLSLNTITGSISPSSSVPGNYGVTCTATPDGCPNVQYQVDVNIVTPPTASISYTSSTYYTNVTTPQPVTLTGSGNYLGGSFSSQPSGLEMNISTGEIYPSSSMPGTYTVSYFVYNGCQTNVTTQVVILNYSNLSITSSTTTAGLFDTITVDVQLSEATDVYSLYMKLKGNPAVSQYLDYSGYTAGTLLGTGSSVISTAPVATSGVYDFGITKVGSVPGYTGGGLFYSFRFVTKNIPIPQGTSFCFYLDNVSAYNSTGNTVNLIYNEPPYCYAFNNQVNVWPGDLNKSNSVTTADLLPIGYFYNATGPARTNTNIQWSAHPATLWGYNHSSQNSDGYKVFADSNGDGVINNADQAAIGLNMNQIHSKMSTSAVSAAPPHFTPQQLTTASGTLTVTPNNTVINGAALPQTVTFTVSVNNTGGLNALYGTSVNLLFDETIFDLNTATVDYTGSIFGTVGADCLALNFNSTNMISVGLTRYANAAIVGQGLLFKVTLQTKSSLGSSLTQTSVSGYVDAANNQVGETLVIQDAPVTNLVITNNLGTNPIKQDDFVLYPNPTNDMVHLVTGTKASQLNNLKLKVITILGQTVEEMNIQNPTTDLSTKNWGATGIYFVQITNSNNTIIMTKKVIVNRK
ncbi:T9SS type A sorting domain-containing protein [Flavobacterium sp. N1994]|uniref:T9SS type A sorting domain-containing protein n=1 Tax=Flavobacterium sp. N1994 TaxID=2986827 RepID=UPI002222A5B9|nr:T9SS type A sorting domain-containing protein [Flavobacterium sp. N1994]